MARNVKMIEFKATAGGVFDTRWQSLKFRPDQMEFTVLGGNVRYSYSPGQAPTANSGHRLTVGGTLVFTDNQDIVNFRFVPESADVDIVITHKAG
jgi:hypothetical protein